MSKIDNPWRKFIENCINGSNYFRASEYMELLADLDRGYAAEARLAEAEELLRECMPELADANTGDEVWAKVDAFLAADSAPVVHDCGKPLKLGQYGECVWCGYMPDKNYPSDQPEAAK